MKVGPANVKKKTVVIPRCLCSKAWTSQIFNHIKLSMLYFLFPFNRRARRKIQLLVAFVPAISVGGYCSPHWLPVLQVSLLVTQTSLLWLRITKICFLFRHQMNTLYYWLDILMKFTVIINIIASRWIGFYRVVSPSFVSNHFWLCFFFL